MFGNKKHTDPKDVHSDREAAYTVEPVETPDNADKSRDTNEPAEHSPLISPISSAPSAFPPQSNVKRRRGVTVWACMLLVALLLLSIVLSVVFTYDIQVRRDENGITLSIVRRENADAPANNSALVSDDPSQTDAALPTPSADVNDGPEDGPTTGDTRLEVETTNGEEALSLSQIYEKCIPSVVSVTSIAQNSSSYGTGVVLSEDGYIITNAHIISGGQQIYVALHNGSEYAASIVGSDAPSDLAVLKIDASGLVPAEFGDSQVLQVGETVVAIGNPLSSALSGTMTDGVVSALNRDISYNGVTMTLIQTNAAINEGNSGGPLINMYGQVVGIVNMKIVSYYSTVEGIGFAIPIASAKPIIDELLEYGYVSGRPAIGVEMQDVPDVVSVFYKLPKGAYVTAVYTDSNAATQGVLPGDIIIGIGGQSISSVEELDQIINQMQVGDTVTLTIYRNYSGFEVDIILEDTAKFSN